MQDDQATMTSDAPDVPAGATFEPLHDRLLVREDERVNETASGLVLPSNVQRQRPGKGTVIAVGPGAYDHHGTLRTVPCEAGDVVLFNPHAGVEIEIDEHKLLMINAGDLLGVLRFAPGTGGSD